MSAPRRRPWSALSSWFSLVTVCTAANIASLYYGGPHVGTAGQVEVWDVAVVGTQLALYAARWRERRAARAAAETSAPAPPRLELKAPNPRPGQCPVCSLEDLDELAVHDDFAREIDPECVQVVPYGPHRAHYACAKTAPYIAPRRSTSGGIAGGAAAEHASYTLNGRLNLCRCAQCEKNREAPKRSHWLIDSDAFSEELAAVGEKLQRLAGMYTPEPAVKAPGDTPGQFWATCRYCSERRQTVTQGLGESWLRLHAKHCPKRPR